jgi:hypothetical protein
VTSVSDWSVMEWLTITGWTVEVKDGRTVSGTATREIYGETLQVTAEGDSAQSVASVLVDRAATEIERWETRQKLLVAA